jgi:hypothetical protein
MVDVALSDAEIQERLQCLTCNGGHLVQNVLKIKYVQ